MTQDERRTATKTAANIFRAKLLATIILIVIAAELAERALHLPYAREVAWMGMVAIFPLAFPALGLREAYLLAVSVGITALQFWIGAAPGAAIAAGLDQAAYLLVFIFLLGMLHEAASTSPSVATCGEYLTRQPAGRRYYALNGGTAALSVLFNIGVVSFLVPLIQKGIEKATPGDARNPIRERRQISALLRGFAWCVIWSPTAIAPLAVAELIPGTDRQVWMLYGVAFFMVILVLGALEDGWRFRAYRPVAKIDVPPFPGRALLGFGAACTCLFGLTAFFVFLTGDTVIFGLLMSCPLVLVGWVAVQNGFPSPAALAPTARRLKIITFDKMAGSAPVALSLACSGYIGRTTADLVPAAMLAETLRLEAMPDFILLGLIPIALSLLSLLALSPIMTAVFFGSLFGALPVLPADPTLIALAISCGWAISMTFSPFATVVLLISRVSGIPGSMMTWSWNLPFAIIGAVSLFPFFALLTGGH